MTYQLTTVAVLLLIGSTPVRAEAPRYEKDVLPIFTKYCFTCHGQSSPKLGLDLRTASGALRGSFNGPVIAKGKPEESLLWKKVSTHQMPPAVYGQTIPDADLEIIKQWIAADAPSDAPVKVASVVPAVVVARCTPCHGDKVAAAGLKLATVGDVLKGSTNGPVIVEGFSDRSVLVRRVSNHSMPPKGSGAPLTEAEINVIREWIDRGEFSEISSFHAADRPFSPLEAPPVTSEQRRFWSFLRPQAVAVPKVRATARVRTPIDAYLLGTLEGKGLSFNPDAAPGTLLRRAYLDLTGLPPTPAEIEEFARDSNYEKLIDKLLASPRYGERWGRQWLDAAGYVDTTGKDFDPKKAEYADGMWRYRDYVIKAFNEDRPWNRFLTEQLAGDELVDWRELKQRTPQVNELLTATGYLRTILDITEEDISNLPVERYEALFKLVEKVSSSTLGLTVNCARCHSHKFDPISQRDYYRFLALFTTAYNPTDWIQPQNHHLYLLPTPEHEAIEARMLDEQLKQIPEPIRADLKAALKTPADKRTEIQKYLFKKFDEPFAKAYAKDHEFPRLGKIQALWDVGTPPAIRLLLRGSADAPGPRVTPGFFEVLTAPGRTDASKPTAAQGKTSGYRLAFAEWLTSPEHPLTARVIVNRIWQGHFGVGLVATPDNFGTGGARPTNQALLDYLATDFIAGGWSAKRLHKQIMMSTAYRQSSRQHDAGNKADPENKLLWRMNLMRLDAETLRDSVISAAGKLDITAGGPPIQLEMRPDGLQVVSSKEPPNAQWRRSIYLTHRRTYPMSFLGVFDTPIIDTNCTRRVPSATPLQSLTMLNDEFIWKAAEALAQRAENNVDAAYLLTLSRKPTAAEQEWAADFLKTMPFRAFAQALLSSNEFLYVD
ncbi:MAG: PSD1 and planctomycete cytochrome C domain-containing protein [Acidobacteria bacterium]|nr:PSD1 and planctomycete cytochrome C domain-containing protein [Acidobacteriota bacterium]